MFLFILNKYIKLYFLIFTSHLLSYINLTKVMVYIDPSEEGHENGLCRVLEKPGTGEF